MERTLPKTGGRSGSQVTIHAHFYALDLERGRVDALHPGRVAKDAATVEKFGARQAGAEAAKRANAEYRRAMRGWQDDLHEEVFSPAGLTRFGPKRSRMTREEWRVTKRAAAARADDLRRKTEIDQSARALGEGWVSLTEMTLELGVEHEDVARRELAATVSELQLSDRERELGHHQEDLERRDRELRKRESVVARQLGILDAVAGGQLQLGRDANGNRLVGVAGEPQSSIARREAEQPTAFGRQLATMVARLEERARHKAEEKFRRGLDAINAVINGRAGIQGFFKRVLGRFPANEQDRLRSEYEALDAGGVRAAQQARRAARDLDARGDG